MDTLVLNVCRVVGQRIYPTRHEPCSRPTQDGEVRGDGCAGAAFGAGEYQFTGRWTHRAAAKAKAAEEKAALRRRRRRRRGGRSADAVAATAATSSVSSRPSTSLYSTFTAVRRREVFVDLAANHPTFGSSTPTSSISAERLCIEPNPMHTATLRAAQVHGGRHARRQ